MLGSYQTWEPTERRYYPLHFIIPPFANGLEDKASVHPLPMNLQILGSILELLMLAGFTSALLLSFSLNLWRFSNGLGVRCNKYVSMVLIFNFYSYFRFIKSQLACYKWWVRATNVGSNMQSVLIKSFWTTVIWIKWVKTEPGNILKLYVGESFKKVPQNGPDAQLSYKYRVCLIGR